MIKKIQNLESLSTLPDDKFIALNNAVRKENKKRNRMKFRIILIILLPIIILFIYFIIDNIKFNEHVTDKINTVRPINNGNIDSIHKNMLAAVKKSINLNILPSNKIRNHHDYQYFFEFFIKKNIYIYKSNKPEGKNVLAELSGNSFSKLIYLRNDNYKINSNNSLIITGAYTSSYKRPVGFFSVMGRIINPAIKNWSGIVIIKNGKVNIENARNIIINFKKLNIVENFEDFKYFIRWVENENVSIFQTHMLINKSKIQVSEGSKKFRRRIIYEDAENNTYIYDSHEEKLTLFDASNILIKEYNAIKAINLDMGTYDFCRYKSDNTIKNCGYLNNTSTLSNVIEIKW